MRPAEPPRSKNKKKKKKGPRELNHCQPKKKAPSCVEAKNQERNQITQSSSERAKTQPMYWGVEPTKTEAKNKYTKI